MHEKTKLYEGYWYSMGLAIGTNTRNFSHLSVKILFLLKKKALDDYFVQKTEE